MRLYSKGFKINFHWSKNMEWNQNVKFIISDVDETIADLYTKATEEMTKELNSLLSEGKVLFLISGQSVKNIQARITDFIDSNLRKNIVIGHCSGVEVWGFDENGTLNSIPFYSLYEDKLTEEQKAKWREIIQVLLKEFKLKANPTMPIGEFKQKFGDDPLEIMIEDRGPQITFEIVKGYNIPAVQAKKLGFNTISEENFDIREPILERASELLKSNNLPITPRLAGVFAIDFAVDGVFKTTAVKYVIENEAVLSSIGLSKEIVQDPKNLEVWGDKFSLTKGGTDRHISEALPKEVRSITFRQENPEEFLEGYNIVVWDGEKHLFDGLLELLKSRK